MSYLYVCSNCQAPNNAESDTCSACGAPIGDADALHEILGAAVLQGGSAGPRLSGVAVPRLGTPEPERKRTVAQTMELDPLDPEDILAEGKSPTAVEGVPVAGVTMEVSSLEAAPMTPPPPTDQSFTDRHSAFKRAAPLAVLAGLAIAGIAYVGVQTAQHENAAVAAERVDVPVDAAETPTVELPAVTTLVGMSDDNKEAYLTMCFRVSENASAECRLSVLRDSGEYPGVETEVGALVADRFEVSNAAYERCVAQGACEPIDYDGCRYHSIRGYEFGVAVPEALRGPTRPAVCVSYAQAETFCAWREMRLPTVPEWQRLARGDSDDLFPWRGSYWAPGILNWGERDMTSYPIPGRLDGAEFTAAVTEYEDGATADGMHNLLGNVAEWAQPEADTEEGQAMTLGGSYVDNVRTLRVTYREAIGQTQRRSTVGFRCVAPTDAPTP